MVTYPDHRLENALRDKDISVSVLWEMKGPRNSNVAWLVCYMFGSRQVIVETFYGGGWRALIDTPSWSTEQIIVDVYEIVNEAPALTAGSIGKERGP